jgi:hypothetical protein
LETETGNFPSIGKNRGQRSEVSGQIFRGLEKYAGDFPRLGKVRAVFSEPRKSNREGARTGRRLAVASMFPGPWKNAAASPAT